MVQASRESAKEATARAAVQLVKEDDFLAIGSGSTVDLTIKALAEKFKGPRRPTMAAASRQSEALMKKLGLQVTPIEEVESFRLMLDGADEVAPDLSLIKGGGGAHLREKLLAKMSKELVIMVDYSKLVKRLGEKSLLPIEVVPFAVSYVGREFHKMGLEPTQRHVHEENSSVPFITDNGNYILDCRLAEAPDEPAEFDRSLKNIVGVVETGLFIGMASRIYIGMPNGRVEEFHPIHGKKQSKLPPVLGEALLERMNRSSRIVPDSGSKQ
jgi:ribose 5-phosphate isomerase A